VSEDPLFLAGRVRRLTWLQRAALAIFAVSAAIIAFFFITIALVCGALLALVIAVRWWWVMRRVRAARKASGPLEGEYVVVERSDRDRLP
jgi:hypothetical protein